MTVMVKRALAEKLPLAPFPFCRLRPIRTNQGTGPLESWMRPWRRSRRVQIHGFSRATLVPQRGLGRFSPGPWVIARLSSVPVQPSSSWNNPPFLPKETNGISPPSLVPPLKSILGASGSSPSPGEGRRGVRKAIGERYRETLRFS